MKKVDKTTLLETATNLMFDIDPLQLAILVEEYEDIFQAFEEICHLPQVDEVEPLFFPYEIFGELRMDIPFNTLTQEEALRNVRNKKDGQIIIPKVIK